MAPSETDEHGSNIGPERETLSGMMTMENKSASLVPWFRFYALLLLIFFEVVAFVFQNIEKKRLGYELSVLVRHKARLIETREREKSSLLDWENLDQLAGVVRAASMELESNRWPIAWIHRHD